MNSPISVKPIDDGLDLEQPFDEREVRDSECLVYNRGFPKGSPLFLLSLRELVLIMLHKDLENGRWAESAFIRFQELIDLTIKYGRTDASPMLRSAMLEELCRLRELYCKAFLERNLSELAAFNRYFDRFAYAA